MTKYNVEANPIFTYVLDSNHSLDAERAAYKQFSHQQTISKSKSTK